MWLAEFIIISVLVILVSMRSSSAGDCLDTLSTCEGTDRKDMDSREDRGKMLAESCMVDEECLAFTDNAVCLLGRCHCREGYKTEINKKCTKDVNKKKFKRSASEYELGNSCENQTECIIPFSVCAGGECSCIEGFETDDDESCKPSTGFEYGESCESNDECTTPNTRCLNKVCSCTTDYSPTDDQCVLSVGSKVGESCTFPADCKGRYSYCIEGKCQCITGYHQQGDDCAPLYDTDTNLVFHCKSTKDCRGKYSVCENENCMCMKGFYYQGHDCIPLRGVVGEYCDIHSNCSTPFSTCLNNKCECVDYHYKQGFECIDIAKTINPYGSHCEGDAECSFTALRYTQCTNKKCLCLPGFVQQGYDCVRAEGIGFFCNKDVDCNVSNSLCNNSRCSCAANYTADGFQCVKISELRRRHIWPYHFPYELPSPPIYECTMDVDCQPPATCNPYTNKCVCPNGIPYSRGCIYTPVIPKFPGSPCAFHSDCSPPILMCDLNDYTCKCITGYISNGYGCVRQLHSVQPQRQHIFTIAPGSSCHSDAHCNPPHLICRRETQTCVCGIGYIQQGQYCFIIRKSPEVLVPPPPPISMIPVNPLHLPNLPSVNPPHVVNPPPIIPPRLILPPQPVIPFYPPPPVFPFQPYQIPSYLPVTSSRFLAQVNIKYATHGIEQTSCKADNECKELYMHCDGNMCNCSPDFKLENGYCILERKIPLDAYQQTQLIVINAIRYPLNSNYDNHCSEHADCRLRHLKCYNNKCKCSANLEKVDDNCVLIFKIPLNYPVARVKRSTSLVPGNLIGKHCNVGADCAPPNIVCNPASKCECVSGCMPVGQIINPVYPHPLYPGNTGYQYRYPNGHQATRVTSHSNHVTYTLRVSAGVPCIQGTCLVRGLVCDLHSQKCVCAPGFTFINGFCEIKHEYQSPIHFQIQTTDPVPMISVNIIDQNPNVPQPLLPESSRLNMYPFFGMGYPQTVPGYMPSDTRMFYPPPQILGIPPHLLLPGLNLNPRLALPPPPPLYPQAKNPYMQRDQPGLMDSTLFGPTKKKRSLGDVCAQNQDCQEIPYTSCLLKSCQCIDGFYPDYDACHMKYPHLEEICDKESKCKTPHSECSLEVLRCRCVKGFNRYDDTCIEDGNLKGICLPGAVCNQPELECHLSRFRCRCKKGYMEHGSDCIEQTN